MAEFGPKCAGRLTAHLVACRTTLRETRQASLGRETDSGGDGLGDTSAPFAFSTLGPAAFQSCTVSAHAKDLQPVQQFISQCA